MRRAITNVLVDGCSDWFPDPWRYVDLRWLAEQSKLDAAVLCSEPLLPPVHLEIATPTGTARRATLLAPSNRVAYQAAVDAVSCGLLATINDLAFGWRLMGQGTVGGRYRSQHSESKRFLRTMRDLLSRRPVLLSMDVKSLYNSLTFDRLASMLSKVPMDPFLVPPVLDVLDGLFGPHDEPHRLPQNHLPSSILANAYLAIALENVPSFTDDIAVVRWMDDLWVSASSVRAAVEWGEQIRSALDKVGLELNPRKTVLFEGREVGPYLEHVAACSGAVAAARILARNDAAAAPLHFGILVHRAMGFAPTAVREFCRETLPTLACPHRIRSAALAAWWVGEDLGWLRRAVRQVPSEGLTRAFLDGVGRRALAEDVKKAPGGAKTGTRVDTLTQ